MLGKLMKYEWRATWKLLLPMNALILVMTLFAYLTVKIDFFDADSAFVVLSGFMVILFYILSMFAVVIGTAIFLIYHFYTSVYGDQGYLLHTLPVDKHHIVIAKVLVSTLWILLSIVLIYLSVFLLFSSDEGFFVSMWESLESYVERLDVGVVGSGFTILMTIIAFVFSLFARVLKVTACISLGQMSSNHKVLVSFAFYYGIYFLQRIFAILYYFVLEVFDADYLTTASVFGSAWEVSLISGILYSVLFYLVTWYCMEKKLNLD